MTSRERRNIERAARRDHIKTASEQYVLIDMQAGTYGVVSTPIAPRKMRRVFLPFGGTKRWIDEPLKDANRYAPPVTPIDRVETQANIVRTAKKFGSKIEQDCKGISAGMTDAEVQADKEMLDRLNREIIKKLKG